MMEIKMDEAGYEVYYSLDEAVKAFSHNIALENATLDLDIGLLLESDVDPFSNYGMEAIGERVKEMASKAKSNFVLYAKKLINLIFGWFIKLIKGVVDIKKSMSANYQKATKYLKALNGYESQARQSSEKTVKITDSGEYVLAGLTFIQFAMQYMNEIGNQLKAAKGQAENKKLTSTILAMTNPTKKLAVALVNLFRNGKGDDVFGQIDQTLRGVDYNCQTLYKNYTSDEAVNKYETFMKEDAADKNADDVKNGKPGVADSNEFDEKVGQADKEAQNAAKWSISNINQVFQDAESVEVKCPEAFDSLRGQLKAFIGISKANKWNFETYAKSIENARRSLMQQLDRIKPNDKNEDDVSQALKAIVDCGNTVAKIQASSMSMMKKINSYMNTLITDVTKLGSVLTTIGGGPAKDKDAEEEN